MITYIAFLRGINVGGKNTIKMADLKRMFEGLGFKEVQTYIQSGNILFKSNEEEGFLCHRIEKEIKTHFGISTAVILRTAEELSNIISACPFTEDEILIAQSYTETEVLYIALLADAPMQKNIGILDSYRTENDEYHIIGRDVYLLLKHSIRDSKLAGNLQKLEMPATVRNWKTISKLSAMAKAIEGYNHME